LSGLPPRKKKQKTSLKRGKLATKQGINQNLQKGTAKVQNILEIPKILQGEKIWTYSADNELQIA
jgi:hypothetical protein